jgi:hypothetical protein
VHSTVFTTLDRPEGTWDIVPGVGQRQGPLPARAECEQDSRRNT